MAAIQNDRDTDLQAYSPRVTPVQIEIDDVAGLRPELDSLAGGGKSLTVTASTGLVVGKGPGPTNPATVTLTATKGGSLTGTVIWSVISSAATLSSYSGDVVTVTGSTIGGAGCAIKASVIDSGKTYEAVVLIGRLGGLAAGDSVSAGDVSGLGSLATQNSVSAGDVTGLGSLATQNSVDLTSQITGTLAAGNVTGLGALALLNAVSAGDVSGLGSLATQSSVNLATQTTGSLANNRVSGLGSLALLNSVSAANVSGLGSLATQNSVNANTQVTNLGSLAYANSIAANQIGAGALAAGVVYAGELNADNITSGTVTGRTVRTSSGSTRVEMSASGNSLDIYASGTRVAQLGGGAAGSYLQVQASAGIPCIRVSNSGVGPAYGVFASVSGNGTALHGSTSSGGVGVSGQSSSNGVALAAEATSTGAAARITASATATTDIAMLVQHNRSGSSSHGARIRNASGVASALIAVGGGNKCFYAESGTFGPFTASHDGVMAKGLEAEEGDIIVDLYCVCRRGVEDALFDSAPSSAPEQRNALGVLGPRREISEWVPAAAIIGYDDKHRPVASPAYLALKDTHDAIDVYAVGEGHINVCGEAGDIEAGDFIVTSSMQGKGMRQSDDVMRSYTVARAREGAAFSDPNQVKQIACIYLCG